jgi:hypothetical protein
VSRRRPTLEEVLQQEGWIVYTTADGGRGYYNPASEKAVEWVIVVPEESLEVVPAWRGRLAAALLRFRRRFSRRPRVLRCPHCLALNAGLGACAQCGLPRR